MTNFYVDNSVLVNNCKTLFCSIIVAFVMTEPILAQRLPIPRASKQPASNLIEAIDYTRSAYQIELLATSTYEAALNTPHLKGETKTLVKRLYDDHQKHVKMLLD